ncbi:fibronectin type III domain-containing protein [Salinithrix halophila]|uniref:Fibronectin type III domain-containing protein n=1 Tax=Salinithrix halophila TaxID=1485204 RepID=A0ABV8JNJ2_9BACL
MSKSTRFLFWAFLVAVVGCMAFVGFQPSVLAENGLKVQTTSKEKSIELSWNSSGDYYKVVLIDENNRGKELWSGKKQKFIHNQLESDRIYEYRLQAFNKEHGASSS